MWYNDTAGKILLFSICESTNGKCCLLHALELEAGLLDGFADVGFGGGASDDEGVGGGGGFAGGDTFHFADRLLAGGFAVVAVHAFDGIDDRPGFYFLFLEFAEEFHTQCYYDE